MTKNILFCHICLCSHKLHKTAFTIIITVKRQHIFLYIVFIAVIHLTIHMNRKIRNNQKILIHSNKFLLNLSVFAHDQTTCHGQRSVKPWSKKHATVALYVQLDICFLHFHLRILFNL